METLKNNKNAFVAGVVLLVLVVVVSLAVHKKESPAGNGEEGDAVESTGSTNSTGKSKTTGASQSGGTSGVLSRADALAKYSGTVVRITDECTGEPHAETFSLIPDSVVMIDNDAKTANTVKLPSGRTVTLEAQHYTLEKITTGGALSSLCDQATHVTTVSVSTGTE